MNAPASAAHLRLALAALLVAVAAWGVATVSVATLLARDAGQREQQWSSPGNAPWRWTVQHPDAVVWAGSDGFRRTSRAPQALAGVVPSGVADLSLALRGERIDPALVAGALVELRSAHAIRLVVLGSGVDGTRELGSTLIMPPGARTRVAIDARPGAALDALRLRLETAPGAVVEVHGVRLERVVDARPVDCAAQRDSAVTLARCAEPVPRLVAPWFGRPEATLAWRDRIRAARPAAIVHPHASVPTLHAARAAFGANAGAAVWWLALLPLAAVIMSRLRARQDRRGALVELMLVFGPWLLLLACGWPDDDGNAAATTVFASSLGAALLLRGPRWPQHLVGARRAWAGAGYVVLLTTPLLLAAAVANACDGDGLVPRVISADDAWRYPAWAMLQQLVLMRCITPRLRLVFGSDRSAALAAGTLFGLLHLPNFALMLVTTAAGAAWAWLGLRDRALLPLVVSHALPGLVLVALAPPWLLRSAEIGGRYLMTP